MVTVGQKSIKIRFLNRHTCRQVWNWRLLTPFFNLLCKICIFTPLLLDFYYNLNKNHGTQEIRRHN